MARNVRQVDGSGTVWGSFSALLHPLCDYQLHVFQLVPGQMQCNAAVLISMPRNVRQLGGLSVFSMATGNNVMWILHSKSISWGLHYLDDFLLLGPADMDECKVALETTLWTCGLVGFSMATEKMEGPNVTSSPQAPCSTLPMENPHKAVSYR